MKVIKTVLPALLCLVLLFSLSACDTTPDESGNSWANDLDLLRQVLEYIDAHYIDGLDINAADVLAAYAVTSGLDNFSYLTDGLSGGGSAGIGVILSVTQYREYRIATIIDNSPASDEKQNGFSLRRGDQIYAVNGKRVEGIAKTSFDEFSAGAAGTTLNLTIKRDGLILPDTYSYTKEVITFPEAVYIDNLGGGISDDLGYIRLRSFTGTAVTDFETCIAALAADGNSGLILDLRDNPGGSSAILEEIASYFVPLEGGSPRKILELDYRDNGVEKRMEVAVRKNNYNDSPLFILTNSGTASASEALIGAARAFNGDHTYIVGQPTYGKGVFQNAPFELIDKQGEATYAHWISIVTGYYYIIDPEAEGGRYNIHKNPILPDIAVDENTVMRELYSDSEIVAANNKYLTLGANN